MNILEQFLNNIAYKFPKGYPDINDKQDMLMIENELKKLGIDLNELESREHFSLRTQQRGTATDIVNLTQKMVGDKDINEIKQQLIEKIETEFKKRLSSLKNLKTLPISFTNTVVYKIIKPILVSQGTKYNLTLQTQSTVGDTDVITNKYSGTFYYVIIDDDVLFTIKLGDQETDNDLIEKTQSHNRQKNRPVKPVKILTFTDFEYLIPLDEPNKEKILTNPNTLPYKLKTSYRPGTNFTHDDYGTGTIIAAASAGTRSGEPDSRGIVDWIEVDFGRPYVTGGQLKKTRTIKNIYTLISPDLDARAAE
jgi:hypothetical protein